MTEDFKLIVCISIAFVLLTLVIAIPVLFNLQKTRQHVTDMAAIGYVDCHVPVLGRTGVVREFMPTEMCERLMRP
jgi:hypothetical protein